MARFMFGYVPILVAVVMPLLFRHSWGVRLFSVLLLCWCIGLHWTHLVAAHRLVMEDGYHHFSNANGELPDAFNFAVDRIQYYNQNESIFFGALILGFIFLALFPLIRGAKNGGDAPTRQ